MYAVAVLVVAGLATTAWATVWIGVSLPDLAAGLGDMGSLVRRMLPPSFDPPGEIASLLLETLAIAIAGTGLATLVSVPCGFWAASSSHAPAALRWGSRGLIVVTRAVPTLVFAILLVRLLGLGPLAGGLAVAAHSVGMIGKLVTDAVDRADRLPVGAVRATGAGRLQVSTATVLPQVVPALVSAVMYRLDINIRASAVLGLVGGGGIGVALQTAMGSLQYQRAGGYVVVIIAMIALLEIVSAGVRRTVGHRATRSQLFAPGRASATPGWDGGRVFAWAARAAVVGAVVVSVWSLGLDLGRLRESWPRMRQILEGLLVPAFSADVVDGVVESLLMAVAATVIGSTVGLVLSLLTAEGVAPVPGLSTLLRLLVVLVRGVPDLVYALLFVAALGLGPYAGLMAMTIGCSALAAKFYTDALEEVDPRAHQALLATGASRSQAFVAGVWPAFVPAYLASTLFVVDLALRESIVLGVVGAGGIGFQLEESVRTLDYGTTSAILLAILLVVVALEGISRTARRFVS